MFATNAVKHFKHEVRGKRRLHKRPNTAEVEACHPWLRAELGAVRGRVIVALGAVAARSLVGKPLPIAKSGASHSSWTGVGVVLVTYHPSAVLRADEAAEEIRAALVSDLRAADALTHGDVETTRRRQ